MEKKYFVAFQAATSLVAMKEMIRSRLCNQLGFVSRSASPAHMTVKTPLALTTRQLDALEDKIAMLVSNKAVQGFEAPLGALSTFDLPDRDEGVVHLPVEGEQARLITNYLLKEFRLPRGEFDGTTPHITLATVLREQLPLTLGELQPLAFPKTTLFNRLSVYAKSSRGAEEAFWFDLQPARAA